MDNKLNLPVLVQCPVHTSEVIQRVNMNINAKKQIYCLECALQSENPKALLATLETLPNFVKAAAVFYRGQRGNIRTSFGPDQEYTQILVEQKEKLKQLSEHIEHEKVKVETTFEEIIMEVIEKINQKKKECLSNLDKQLANLQSHYLSFEKQLKKAFPQQHDLEFLYPSKEEIEKRLSHLRNAAELESFVKATKEDMAHDHVEKNPTQLSPEDKKSYFDDLAKKLKEQESMKPVVGVENVDMSFVKATMQEALDRLFQKSLPIKDQIMAGSLLWTFAESTIFKREQLNIVKEWMPLKYSFDLRLLYRASADGFTPYAFHDRCDGRGATLTFIKCQFHKSSKMSIIGGFLNKSWSQFNDYISSDEAFIFSLTKEVRCHIGNPQYAAYGGPRNGPRFGNCDIHIYSSHEKNFDHTLIRPNSYIGTAKIVESDKYGGTGEIVFKLLEIEVYQVR